jgi:tight adherence protein B
VNLVTNFIQGSSPLPLTIAALLVAACAGLLFSGLSLLASERRRRHNERVMRVLAPFRAVTRGRDPAMQILRRDTSRSSIKPLNELLHKIIPDVQKFRRRLRQASRTLTMDQYLLASLFLATIATVGLALFLPWPFILSLIIGVLIGIFIPYACVLWMAKRRQNRFVAIFPDAIDIIVRAVRSGQPPSEAIRVVSEQAPEPVSGEFREITAAVRVGVTLNEAIGQAAERIDLTEFRYFHTALNIQQETGGNLSETLDNLSKMLRRRRQIKLKIRAASAEARASAWIVGSLPFIMFFVIQALNHDYAVTLIVDPRGIIMVAVAFASTCIGIAVMAKMANFDY